MSVTMCVIKIVIKLKESDHFTVIDIEYVSRHGRKVKRNKASPLVSQVDFELVTVNGHM